MAVYFLKNWTAIFFTSGNVEYPNFLDCFKD